MNRLAMKIRFLSAIVFGVALTMTAFSQDANSGQRGGRGGWGGMSGGGGITGTVTEVAADHYIIKTDGGETYTIHFSANTRIMKQTARQAAAILRRRLNPLTSRWAMQWPRSVK
jgi:hypothetical protein